MLFQESLRRSLTSPNSHSGASPISLASTCPSLSRSEISSLSSERREPHTSRSHLPRRSRFAPKQTGQVDDSESLSGSLADYVSMLPRPPIWPAHCRAESTLTSSAALCPNKLPISQNSSDNKSASKKFYEDSSSIKTGTTATSSCSSSTPLTPGTLKRHTKTLKSILRSNGYDVRHSSQKSESSSDRSVSETHSTNTYHVSFLHSSPVTTSSPPCPLNGKNASPSNNCEQGKDTKHDINKNASKAPTKNLCKKLHSSYGESQNRHDSEVAHQDPPSQMVDFDKVLERTLETDAYVEVIDLPWTEVISPNRKGIYSGMVNHDIRPHGKGTWICSMLGPKKESMDILRGIWYNGSFISEAWKECLSQKLDYAESTGIDTFSKETHNEKVELPIPPPPFCQRKHETHSRNGVDTYSKENHEEEEELPNEVHILNARVALKYVLGEPLHSHHDSLPEGSKENNNAVCNLKKHDFAFVMRSDRTWSYAILAERYSHPRCADGNKDKSEDMEGAMTFVIDPLGRTKKIRQKYWGKCIRCVQPRHDESRIESKNKDSCRKSRSVSGKNIIEDNNDSFLSSDSYHSRHAHSPILC